MRILRLSPSLLARVEGAPGLAGRIHSVFASAVNLVWEDGHLATLHGAGWMRAPFAMACDVIPEVAPGCPVRGMPGRLAVGRIEIGWEDAALWDPGPPPPAPLVAFASTAWVPPDPCGVRAPIARGLTDLAAAISCRSMPRFLSSTMALVGRGEGLTPAGDDCLVGALATLWRFDPFWRAHLPALRPRLLAHAARATTRLSAEFLAHALRGAFAEPLLRLATACDPAAALEAVAALRRFGATSGLHILAGFAAAHRATGS